MIHQGYKLYYTTIFPQRFSNSDFRKHHTDLEDKVFDELYGTVNQEFFRAESQQLAENYAKALLWDKGYTRNSVRFYVTPV